MICLTADHERNQAIVQQYLLMSRQVALQTVPPTCCAGELVAQGTHTKFLPGYDALLHGPRPAAPPSKL